MLANRIKTLASLVTVLALCAGVVHAAPQQVNVSGATLFRDFFTSFASTNDWVDVDEDGVFGWDPGRVPVVDQLALPYPNAASHWNVIYRGVGSGNGLAELVKYYNTAPGMELALPTDTGFVNRTIWFDQNGLQAPGNINNPGGAPYPQNNVDVGIMDVPTSWFVVSGNEVNARWNATPATDGYGLNPIRTWDDTDKNLLKSLGNLNTNTANPDHKTVYDWTLAWVPVAYIANAGADLENVTKAELQHLFVTGRMLSGENLAAATRDAGSGTRNAAMNSIGVDPSWGQGDNVGKKFGNAERFRTRLGANHQVANCGGSGLIEDVVQNRRLAVGYTGLMGGSRAAADALAGLYEIINVSMLNDDPNYTRPSLYNVVKNSDPGWGWQIGGPQTWATVGDPYSGINGNTNPAMFNPAGADYVRNILQSIKDYVDPAAGQADDDNMPGQYLATNWTLMAGMDAVPLPLFPDVFQPNPDFVQAIQDVILRDNVLVVPAYGSIGSGAGRAPIRVQLTGGETYADGNTQNYTDSGGNTVLQNSPLSKRNRVAGDFAYNGRRDMDDIPMMMQAFSNPTAFEAGNNNGGDGYVVVHIIGDFDGNGNFDAEDARYFADGLALVDGQLDRAAGFAAVDAAWTAARAAALGDPAHPAGNFFNTTLATGRAYQAGSGWSKADIAGSGATHPGSAPVGADSVIDAADIDYVHQVLRNDLQAKLGLVDNMPLHRNVREHSIDWQNLDEAAWADLSCDMNGDLVIDGEDVRIIVEDILGTDLRDVNLDGVVDAGDRDTIIANICEETYGRSWADGDISGDGYVTWYDVYLFDSMCNVADINKDGVVDMLDFALLAANWLDGIE